MHFEEAAERLARLPDRVGTRLPSGPASLMPVLTDGRPRTEFRLGQVAGDRPAAVLVLIAPASDGSAVVILTERSTYDGAHSGEVSFPGGRAGGAHPFLGFWPRPLAADGLRGMEPVPAGVG